MGEIAERSQWYKGKEPIMENFSMERRGVLSMAASRVDYAPGYLTDAITKMEIKAKHELSDLNYKIISEAIDRELTQQTFDYNELYKSAMITWEIDKANLISSLQGELVDAQKNREDKETLLADLAVETGLRQVALINAKTLLAQEIERIKKEIIEAKKTTLPKEIEYVEAQLTTTEKKVTLIPHLESLITAEEELIAKENLNIPYKKDLIEKRTDLIPIKESLISLKEILIIQLETLTNPKLNLAEKKIILAEAKEKYETKVKDKLTPTLENVAALETLNTAMKTYLNKRGELVIPYDKQVIKLQELIEPQTEYAQAMLNNIPYLKDLATKQEPLHTELTKKADKTRELFTPLINKADKTKDYAQNVKDIAEIEEETKQIYKELESLKKTGIEADFEVMNKELSEGDLQKALIQEQVVLHTVEADNQTALISKESVDSATYFVMKETGQTQTIAKETEAASIAVDTQFDVNIKKSQRILDSAKTTIGASVGNDGSIEKIAKEQANAREKVADINAQADITSKLIHQLT